MADTYTVKKGDNLTKIAAAHNTTVAKLVELNDITNPDYIVVGQVLKLSGTATAKKTNNSNKATIKAFGLQSNTDRTIYATWTWDKSNTENYEVEWYYATGDGIWFVGNDSTVDVKQSTYNAPSNATKVKFKVKPISKKRKVGDKETSYWTASWSTEKTFVFATDAPPTKPDTPDVELEKYKLTITSDSLENANATHIQYQIVKNNSSVYKTVKVEIKTGHASYSCTVPTGGEYKVRARTVRKDMYSDWSAYSDNHKTAPAAPAGFVYIKSMSETEVQLDWETSANADTYRLQYTTEKRYFDSGDFTEKTVDAKVASHAELTGLQSGEEYFIRVRAENEKGESAWTEIVSIKVGTKPGAPTTWSSTTTAKLGEIVNLYWIHNSTDGSSQTYAVGQIFIGDSDTPAMEQTIKNSTDEDEKDKTSVYSLDTSVFEADTRLRWWVKTCGVTGEYGEWSVMRTIYIYEEPTLELNVTDVNGNQLETLTTFPFYISGLASPNTQAPIGYYLSIVSNSIYETVDAVGNPKIVNVGEAVYSKHFDIDHQLVVEMSAGNVDLENNISYTVRCTVSLDSGLTAENESEFTVAWTDEEYSPNAEIGIDEENWSAIIRPYCEDENAVPIADISLSVYRREFDGTFTLIAEDIPNGNNTFVTDPHPSLDYARYRVVAKTNSTGAISYYDIPGVPVDCYAVIIQWDEEWSSFDTTNEDAMEQPNWAGSMLSLPYNIDVSESNNPDVSLIEYIGRENAVAYYGTQQGYSATWNMVIPYDDKETLYGLRRLQRYMGDVYVREPSGTGFWANVKVSFSQKHRELTIPVTLSITRVEGGI